MGILNPVILRVIAALGGGYILTNLVALSLVYVLPGSLDDRILTGTFFSFLIYAAIIMWVFSVKTLRQLWIGMALLATACFMIIIGFNIEVLS